jgi:hypothetical protein
MTKRQTKKRKLRAKSGTNNPNDLNFTVRMDRAYTPLELAKLRLLTASAEHSLEMLGVGVALQRKQFEMLAKGTAGPTSSVAISQDQLAKLNTDEEVCAAALAYAKEHEKEAALQGAVKKTTARARKPRRLSDAHVN